MSGTALGRFCGSTIGLKVLMAATGVVLFGYCVGHMSGNLLVFAGREKMNAYAAWIHTSPGMLWTARVVLLASVIAHIYASVRLTKLKAAARPVPYAGKEHLGSTFAARTMMWSGPFIALFVVYHILHLTTGTVHHEFKGWEDAYHNVVSGFQNPLPSIIYIAAMVLLGLHLSHGVWSMLQTVGVNRPQWEPCLRGASLLISIVIIVGFISVPVACLAGWVE